MKPLVLINFIPYIWYGFLALGSHFFDNALIQRFLLEAGIAALVGLLHFLIVSRNCSVWTQLLLSIALTAAFSIETKIRLYDGTVSHGFAGLDLLTDEISEEEIECVAHRVSRYEPWPFRAGVVIANLNLYYCAESKLPQHHS